VRSPRSSYLYSSLATSQTAGFRSPLNLLQERTNTPSQSIHEHGYGDDCSVVTFLLRGFPNIDLGSVGGSAYREPMAASGGSV
jgi:hypothetical protein